MGVVVVERVREREGGGRLMEGEREGERYIGSDRGGLCFTR